MSKSPSESYFHNRQDRAKAKEDEGRVAKDHEGRDVIAKDHEGRDFIDKANETIHHDRAARDEQVRHGGVADKATK